MTEFIGSIFASIFGVHSGIATVIISMFPLIELKGGIPVGMSVDFWGNYAHYLVMDPIPRTLYQSIRHCFP